MAARIQVPPFPELTWNDYSWAGEVCLPSWAKFERRRRPDAPCDGTARLTVVAKEMARPIPEQVAAFQHLLDNEVVVADAVAMALLAYYPGERQAYLDSYGLEESDEVPEIVGVAGLQQLVGLSSIHVLSLARDGMACIGFGFRCVWDDEHGAGVMTHHGRVIATGHADCSFVKWMAEEGLNKH